MDRVFPNGDSVSPGSGLSDSSPRSSASNNELQSAGSAAAPTHTSNDNESSRR